MALQHTYVGGSLKIHKALKVTVLSQAVTTEGLTASPMPWVMSDPVEDGLVLRIRDVPAGAPGLGRTDSGQPGRRKAARASSDCTASDHTCVGAGSRRSVARRPSRPFVDIHETIANEMTDPRKRV